MINTRLQAMQSLKPDAGYIWKGTDYLLSNLTWDKFRYTTNRS